MIKVNVKFTSACLESERIARRMTQKEVADAIGVSAQSISNWERGKSLPSTYNMMALSTLFDTPLDEMVLYRPA